MSLIHLEEIVPSMRRSVYPMTNIVVLVKQVPDTNAKIVVSGDRVDLSAVKKVMSPYDEFAVETALQHREAAGGEVTAVTVGGAGAEKILKDAKAIGVDHIVRIDADGKRRPAAPK